MALFSFFLFFFFFFCECACVCKPRQSAETLTGASTAARVSSRYDQSAATNTGAAAERRDAVQRRARLLPANGGQRRLFRPLSRHFGEFLFRKCSLICACVGLCASPFLSHATLSQSPIAGAMAENAALFLVQFYGHQLLLYKFSTAAPPPPPHPSSSHASPTPSAL